MANEPMVGELNDAYFEHVMKSTHCACGKAAMDESGVVGNHQCNLIDLVHRINILEMERDELKEKLDMAIRLIEEAQCCDVDHYGKGRRGCHGPWCNGVHAEGGACEGAYAMNDLYRRLTGKEPWKIPDISLEAK